MNNIKLLEDMVYGIYFCETPTMKKYYITNYLKSHEDLRDDFNLMLKVLTGEEKLGYSYIDMHCDTWCLKDDCTFKDVFDYLMEPRLNHDLSMNNILDHCRNTSSHGQFLEMVFNRDIKLGIGKSLIEHDNVSPMLAKRFDEAFKEDRIGYYLTEKLDGNRCIAQYDTVEDKWKFYSRNGKEMRVSFDMSGLDTGYVYDGEVLSVKQTENSGKIYDLITKGIAINHAFDDNFSSTNGIINSNSISKDLVYNIFDIVTSECYIDRRKQLDEMHPQSKEVRIVPVLRYYNNADELKDNIHYLLDKVTSYGAEGLMLNTATGAYQNKRTNELLKLKKAYTMDMVVINTFNGKGKYADCVGGLICGCTTEDGKHIVVEVGTGLSDYERLVWKGEPKRILGKIVEVEYFSISQNRMLVGTNEYSLRFPRLKRVRDDKNEVSEN